MAKKVQKKKKPVEKPAEIVRPKDFLDMIAPTTVKFFTDYAVIGGAYHTFMAVRGYGCERQAGTTDYQGHAEGRGHGRVRGK